MAITLGLGLLILRVIGGLTLAAHGTQKLFGWFEGPGLAKLSQGFEKQGFKPVWLWVCLVNATTPPATCRSRSARVRPTRIAPAVMGSNNTEACSGMKEVPSQPWQGTEYSFLSWTYKVWQNCFACSLKE